jgi:aminopeptidase YwaD
MKRNLLTVIILFTLCSSKAQDRTYAQFLIDTLASPSMHGRGYVQNGDIIASQYIKKELEKHGVKPFHSSYFHKFQLSVNTFPEVVQFEGLETGRDFIVHAASPSIKLQNAEVDVIDPVKFEKYSLKKLLRKYRKCEAVYLDTVPKALSKKRQEFVKQFKGSFLIDVQRELTWSVSRLVKTYAHVQVLPGKIVDNQRISVDIQNKYVENYKTRNVLGYLEGTEHPDSFLILTAHYDHLGRMGKDVYIAGANDNASGTAMMLDMAKYYAANPPKFTVVFIAFAAEEAGLVGSYYLHRQLEDYLDKGRIKFLLNMDLMGSGEDGVMAVNGKVFGPEFDLLKSINDEKGYLVAVKKRGKAANSDHYWFTEIGVHAFFVYLMGEYSYYHEIDDNAENLRLGIYYDRTFLLLRDFLNALSEN